MLTTHRTMQNRSKGNHIISSFSHQHSIHFVVHNFYPITLSTTWFLNRHYWMESNKGFSYDLGFCQHYEPPSWRNIGTTKLSMIIRHKQGVMLQTHAITGDLSCDHIVGPFLFLLSFIFSIVTIIYLLTILFLLSKIPGFSFLSLSWHVLFSFLIYIFSYINSSYSTCNFS